MVSKIVDFAIKRRLIWSSGLLLYLHIPFCHRICPYCSFYKHTPGSTPIGRFIDALANEARQRVQSAPRTLYLGGGTPSMLSPAHLEKLFGTLHEECEEFAFSPS